MPNTLRVLALATALGLAPPSAGYSQSPDAIQRYIAKANRTCQITLYTEYYRGPVAGMKQPVVVAAYTAERCGGGNNYRRMVSAFYGADILVRQLKPPRKGLPGPDVGDKTGVSVRGDTLTIRYSDYGAGDARCCPSLRKTARFRLSGGGIIPVR